MLICPYCKKELLSNARILTKKTFDYIFTILNVPSNCDKEKLKSFMYRVLKLTPNITVYESFQFLWKVNNFSYKEIYDGLEKFFDEKWDKAGYDWQWAVSMIRRNSQYKKRKILKLPKEIL